MRLLIFSSLLVCFMPVRLLAVEVAPRITDREIIERLTRLEEGQRSLEQRMAEGFAALGQRLDETNRRLDDISRALSQRLDDTNRALSQRLDDTSRRIDELREYLLWGFGVMFAGMFVLMGFVLWDRRTALAPAVRRTEELQERERRLEAALKEYAATSPELAASLKKEGLL